LRFDTLSQIEQGNNIGPQGGAAIAEALKVNASLCHLVLFGWED
jgi:hypothetical protein